MFAMRCKTRMDTARVRRAAKRGSVKSLAHAAALIRKIARRSIRRRKDPAAASPAGRPPFTHRRGRGLRDAIRFAVDRYKTRAVVGPAHSVVGAAGAAHEFGGEYRGDQFDKRPFMGPALDKAAPDLPAFWRHSVKEA